MYLAFHEIKSNAVTWEPTQNHDWKYERVLCENSIRFPTVDKGPSNPILRMSNRMKWCIWGLNGALSWNRECRSSSPKRVGIMVSRKLTKFYDQYKLGSCKRLECSKICLLNVYLSKYYRFIDLFWLCEILVF